MEQVKRGRGRPPKVKNASTPKPVEKDPLLRLIQLKFMDTYGFEPTEYQAKQFLLTLVAQVEL
jgi:hypothetical protein